MAPCGRSPEKVRRAGRNCRPLLPISPIHACVEPHTKKASIESKPPSANSFLSLWAQRRRGPPLAPLGCWAFCARTTYARHAPAAGVAGCAPKLVSKCARKMKTVRPFPSSLCRECLRLFISSPTHVDACVCTSNTRAHAHMQFTAPATRAAAAVGRPALLRWRAAALAVPDDGRLNDLT